MIKITPHRTQEIVLDAVRALGFQLRNSDNEYSRYSRHGYEQEFEYYPSPEFRSYLDELEIAFTDLSEDQLVLKLTIDRKVRGLTSFFAEMAGTDDRKLLLTFNNRELLAKGAGYVASQIQDTIHRYKR
jgi:sporulation-control protein